MKVESTSDEQGIRFLNVLCTAKNDLEKKNSFTREMHVLKEKHSPIGFSKNMPSINSYYLGIATQLQAVTALNKAIQVI